MSLRHFKYTIPWLLFCVY